MKKIAVILGAITSAILIAAGIASAQPTPPPAAVGATPIFATNTKEHAEVLSQPFGTSRSLVAQFDNITPADLQRMGISYPEWENGAPPMTLFAISGTFGVSTVGQDAPYKTTAEMIIHVVDTRTGIPTVTIVGPSAQLNAMLALH